jgi:hypothetical protein
MATTQIGDFLAVWHKAVICTHPTTPLNGKPCRVGLETALALTGESAAGTDLSGNLTGYTSVDVGPFRALVSVKGVNDSGNSAVADGDMLFYVDADINDGTGFLSKKSSGYFWGWARGAVNSGATSIIAVDHQGTPGSGTLAAGSIGTSNIANNAITTALLTSTLGTGFIPLPLAQARLIATNDIAAKNATDGGLISLDTDPTLKRVNGATDKQLRIAWAANSVIPITWSFPYPPDLDDAAAVVVNLLAGMAGATDTPVVAVSYWEGVGDTNAGGNTTALAAAVAQKTVTIAAGDVGAYPKAASIDIIPAAHANDAIYLYAAWITYTRK